MFGSAIAENYPCPPAHASLAPVSWKPLAVVFALTSVGLAAGWYREHDAAVWAERQCAADKDVAGRAYSDCIHIRTGGTLGHELPEPCRSDVECKGDRVCRAGVCAER